MSVTITGEELRVRLGAPERPGTETEAYFELIEQPDHPGWIVRGLIYLPDKPGPLYAASSGATPELAWESMDRRGIRGYLGLPGLAGSEGDSPWVRRWPRASSSTRS